jgi:uncharacterized membrane protein
MACGIWFALIWERFELLREELCMSTQEIATPSRPEINLSEMERLLSIGGGALAFLYALDRRPPSALIGFLVGGGLLYRGISGHCSVYQSLGVSSREPHLEASGVSAQHGERVEGGVVIPAPPAEVYSQWRKLEDLPTILSHVKSVVVLSPKRSRWQLETPFGMTLSWEAEIITDEPNQTLAWQSLPGASLRSAGTVRFEPLDDGKLTRLTVTMKYEPPGGKLGIWVAKALGTDLGAQLEEDLRTFKDSFRSEHAPLSKYVTGSKLA